MQPVIVDAEDVARFKANAVVVFLLDSGGIDMNRLVDIYHGRSSAETWDGKPLKFSRDDMAHFHQLIGCSVSGYADLDYVSDELYFEADKEADRVLAEKAK